MMFGLQCCFGMFMFIKVNYLMLDDVDYVNLFFLLVNVVSVRE